VNDQFTIFRYKDEFAIIKRLVKIGTEGNHVVHIVDGHVSSLSRVFNIVLHLLRVESVVLADGAQVRLLASFGVKAHTTKAFVAYGKSCSSIRSRGGRGWVREG